MFLEFIKMELMMINKLNSTFFVFLLLALSFSVVAGDVSKIVINIYSSDGSEESVITTFDSSRVDVNTATSTPVKQRKQIIESKFYIGSGFGKIKSDFVASASVGYKLRPNFAIEGGLLTSAEVFSLGSSDGTTSGTTDGKAYSMTLNAGLKTTTQTSYMLGVNHSIPLNNNLKFFSKAGLFFWGVDYALFIDGTITYDGTTYTPSGSIPFATAQGSNLYYGIGATYAITNEASIRAEYTKTEIAGIDIGGLSTSAVFNF